MVFQNTKNVSPIGLIIKESLISPHHCKKEIVRGLIHCIDTKEGVRRASTKGAKEETVFKPCLYRQITHQCRDLYSSHCIH